MNGDSQASDVDTAPPATIEWVCPACFGSLKDAGSDGIGCTKCGANYSVTAGIPDFRLEGAAWVDFDSDRENALALHRTIQEVGFRKGLESIFEKSRGFPKKKSGLSCQPSVVRKGQVFAAVRQLAG